MEKRRIGQSDISLSIVGLGGVVVMNRPQEEADEEVARAFEQGVNYFDVAPSYGNAQERLGPALKPYRRQVNLACKTGARNAREARLELEASLRTLQTDHFDIYQMHGLESVEETRAALAEGGAIETFLDAKKRGLTRLIGFSAHDEEAALLAIASGHFDTMLLPLNFVMWEFGSFGRRALEAARKRGMGVMAIKSMARERVPEGQPTKYEGCWYSPEERAEISELLLRWTLSLPGVSAALPPGNPMFFHHALQYAERFKPIDAAGLEKLQKHLSQARPIFANQG